MTSMTTSGKQFFYCLLFLLFIFFVGSVNAQHVSIPDANFKAALLADSDINTNEDGEIQVSEAQAYTGLIKVNGESISDLTGIEAFVNLTKLKVHYNNLGSVDLSANTKLRELHIQHNALTVLDLSSNSELEMLRLYSNHLSSLDLSANGKLRHLEVNNNNLTSLNIQNGRNPAIYKFEAGGNPGLSCIQVDDVQYAESEWTDNVDSGVSFSVSCTSEPTVDIPDPNFKAALLANAAINTNGDGEIQVSETRGVTEVNANGVGLSDINGIEAFDELLVLDVRNNNLTSLDASSMGLDYLGCSNNQLTSLNLGGIIEYLDADGNPTLSCIQTATPGYYYEGNPNVTVDPNVTFSASCAQQASVVNIPDANFLNALIEDGIDLNGDGLIQESETQYTYSLDVSGEGISDLTGIQAFGVVESLNVSNNNLTTLDVRGINLMSIDCSHNQLTEIIFETPLEYITINDNQLTSFELTDNQYVLFLNISNNNLYSLDLISDTDGVVGAGLTAQGNPNLTCIQVKNPDKVANGPATYVDQGVVFTTDCRYGEPVVDIPDAKFKAALLADAAINTNSDNEIQVSETSGITEINANGAGISDITGIEAFGELLVLDVRNNNLTSLDASIMGLDYLGCSNNQLTSLNVGGIIEYMDADGNPGLSCIQTATPGYYYEGNPNITVDPGVTFSATCTEPVVAIPDANFKAALLAKTDVNTNGDDEIQASEAAAVYELDVAVSDITDLTGIEAFTSLMVLYCNANDLTALDVSANTNLVELYCQQNRLTELAFHENLDKLNADFNNLGAVDISETPVNYLSVRANNLTSLNLKTGTVVEYLYANLNPNLYCILVDEDFLEDGLTRNVDAGTVFSTSCGSEEVPVVDIPDANFKAALLAMTDVNSNGDGEIQVTETRGVYELDVRGYDIADLTGIKSFEDLEILDCADNQLTFLDVQGLQLLFSLDCSDNAISDIQISRLFELDCSNNNLTSLNLKPVFDSEMYLNWDATGNPLTCVEVYDVVYAESNWSSSVDPGVVFSTDCSSTGDPVVYIPDANFKSVLLADGAINTNHDGDIQVSEAETYSGSIKVNGENIADLTGIEAFVNLYELKAHYNNLTSIDLSSNTALVKLHLQGNDLTSLDLSANPMLDMLRAQGNDLTSLDLRANTSLRYLEVQNNALLSLNVKNGNNSVMYKFEAAGNADLNCIEVDDAAYAASKWSDDVDGSASFSEDCSGSGARIAAEYANQDASLSVSVYPNPSSDYLRVVSDDSIPNGLRLYSIKGDDMNVRFQNGEADIQHLKSGMYILKGYKGGESITLKVVKN